MVWSMVGVNGESFDWLEFSTVTLNTLLENFYFRGSEFRNCKDILKIFSRDLLRGEGDIIKHLGFLGYRVNYQQTYIDEFDFGISKIAVDLR